MAFVCFPGFCGRRPRVRREEYRTDFVLTRVDGAPPLLDLPSYSTTPPLYFTRRKRLRPAAAPPRVTRARAASRRLRCQMGSDRTRWAVGRHNRTGARTPVLGGSGLLALGTRCVDADALGVWDRGSHSLCLGWWARFRNQQACLCLVTCRTVQCSCSYRAGMGAEAHTRARVGLLAH